MLHVRRVVMSRSLKKLHIAALCGVIACALIAALAICLWITEPANHATVGDAAIAVAATADTGAGMRPLYIALALLALGSIVVINAWLYRMTIPTMRHDIYTLVRLFKDVRQGAVRVAYPVMLHEFAAAHRYLRSWSTEMLAEKERLTGMGLIDHLSQLSNRRHFDLRLKELFDTARTHANSSVLIIDVDHFKQINDRHGHDAGDSMIVQFAALLRANVRHTDVLARLGGDEFCIIYTYIPLDQATELAERLRRALPRQVELKPGVHHDLRWTGGLSAFHDSDTKPDDVLRRADQALLRAKEAGRHRTMVYHPDTGLSGAPSIVAG